jgi:serine/threonine-protein kinase HipA
MGVIVKRSLLMANLLWGRVFYKNHFAGIIKEEPGEKISFSYDPSYLESGYPSISYTLQLQEAPHISINGLHPFFDNLVAEGWLESAQIALLGKRSISRFELLLAFGYDCAGAVSVIDPEPTTLSNSLVNVEDSKEKAIITSRASLSGVQPKLAIIERGGQYFPARIGELSTHIAKFPSSDHDDLITNEYLTMQAFKALLPDDDIVDLSIGEVIGVTEPALIIKRFDRKDGDRLHFEEFNQLLNKKSTQKYNGSYKDMSEFILQTKGCLPIENYRLYARIITGLILGNTDMHFKNFAMLHTPTGLRLTPSYDQVAAFIYRYKTVALSMNGSSELLLARVKPKNIIALAHDFQLSDAVVGMLMKQLNRNREKAKESIFSAKVGNALLKDQLINQMDARWNGTFTLIGKLLSKKQ